jgi:hypothetical protein
MDVAAEFGVAAERFEGGYGLLFGAGREIVGRNHTLDKFGREAEGEQRIERILYQDIMVGGRVRRCLIHDSCWQGVVGCKFVSSNRLGVEN